MLVLRRELNETICIGEHVKVTVTYIGRNQVRLGIEAPADMRVDREEIRKSKDAERNA